MYFNPIKNGLYFHNIREREICLLNIQNKNSRVYSQLQIARAKKTRDTFNMLRYPSIKGYKKLFQINAIMNYLVTVKDITIADKIFV